MLLTQNNKSAERCRTITVCNSLPVSVCVVFVSSRSAKSTDRHSQFYALYIGAWPTHVVTSMNTGAFRFSEDTFVTTIRSSFQLDA